MIKGKKFDPNEHRFECEIYLTSILAGSIRFIQAEELPRSTRYPAWRLDAEVDGEQRSYVLRLGLDGSEHEFEVMRAMEAIPIPTPSVYGWDPAGDALGVAAFFYEFIEGQTLLPPMLAGERWAEELFVDAVCELQAVTKEQLAPVAQRIENGETALDVLERAYEYLKLQKLTIVDEVHRKLIGTMPESPALRFSNGDLWLENFIIRDRKLASVIDFANAGFSDPLYEFLLPFFVEPKLRGRGIEEMYCDRMGFDPEMMVLYHGLEYFDTLYWVILREKPFVHYTAENLMAYLDEWLKMS